MGLKYLWDTNTVIYYLQNQFSVSGEKFIDNVVENSQPAISVITEIELLCWKTATKSDLELLQNFISNSIIYELSQDIKLKTIEVRKQSTLKLPDAIIAATASVNELILISRNIADFRKVTALELLDHSERFSFLFDYASTNL